MARSREISQSLILVVSFLIVLTLFQLVHKCTAAERDDGLSGDGPFDCMRIMMRAAKKIMKSLTFCSKLFKENTTSNKEYGEKLPCIMKCTMQRIQLLNENGVVDPASIKNMMRDYIPNQILLNQVKDKVVDGCTSAADKLDPTDEACKSYGEYALCLQVAVEEYKDTSPLCIKRPKKNS